MYALKPIILLLSSLAVALADDVPDDPGRANVPKPKEQQPLAPFSVLFTAPKYTRVQDYKDGKVVKGSWQLVGFGNQVVNLTRPEGIKEPTRLEVLYTTYPDTKNWANIKKDQEDKTKNPKKKAGFPSGGEKHRCFVEAPNWFSGQAQVDFLLDEPWISVPKKSLESAPGLNAGCK